MLYHDVPLTRTRPPIFLCATWHLFFFRLDVPVIDAWHIIMHCRRTAVPSQVR